MAAGFYLAATFRTLGAAALTHNLFTIENTHASKLVMVRRLVVQLDATAALVVQMPQVKTSRLSALPTGGTALAKAQFDTNAASDGAIVVRGATASDGGTATAITATLNDVMWQQYCMRLHTAVGQVLGLDNPILPTLIENTPVILRQNQALLVQVVAAVTTSNPATNHWFVQCVWEET